MEAFKSAFLVVLVLLSVWLTGQFLYGGKTPPASPRSGYAVEVVDIRAQVELLNPERILLHLGGDQHTVLTQSSIYYGHVWDGTRELLASAELAAGSVKYVPSPDIETLRKEYPGIEPLAPVSLPLGTWRRIWGGSGGSGEISASRFLVVFSGEPALYIPAGDGRGHLRFPIPEGDPLLKQFLRELGGSRYIPYTPLAGEVGGLRLKDGIYVPDRLPTLGPLLVEPEGFDPVEMAKSFFPDMSVVRKIEERDGAVLYTDGRRVMRAYPSGSMEYNVPSDSGSPSPPDLVDALEIAFAFARKHGGLPEGALITSVAEVKLPDTSERRFVIDYSFKYGDIPVVGYEPPIRAVIGRDGVQEYGRAMRLPVQLVGELKRVISPERALQALASEYDGRTVVDAYLGFLNQPRSELQSTMVPVWAVEFDDGERVYVDGFSGLVYRKPTEKG